MALTYPLEYSLESGTVVVVRKDERDTYSFSLRTTDGLSDNFTYTDGDERSRKEIEDELDFDQLNALRAFWLKREQDS